MPDMIPTCDADQRFQNQISDLMMICFSFKPYFYTTLLRSDCLLCSIITISFYDNKFIRTKAFPSG